MKYNAPMKKDELVYFPTWMSGRSGYADRIRELFADYQRKKRLRTTQQRSKILDFLLQAHIHVSQDDIYNALKKNGIGRVTVFRALKLLEEAHLVDRVTDSQGHYLYEVNFDRPHHDHLICLLCGTIQEIRWPQIETIQEKKCAEIGFNPVFHRHEIYGHCKACQSANKGN